MLEQIFYTYCDGKQDCVPANTILWFEPSQGREGIQTKIIFLAYEEGSVFPAEVEAQEDMDLLARRIYGAGIDHLRIQDHIFTKAGAKAVTEDRGAIRPLKLSAAEFETLQNFANEGATPPVAHAKREQAATARAGD